MGDPARFIVPGMHRPAQGGSGCGHDGPHDGAASTISPQREMRGPPLLGPRHCSPQFHLIPYPAAVGGGMLPKGDDAEAGHP